MEREAFVSETPYRTAAPREEHPVVARLRDLAVAFWSLPLQHFMPEHETLWLMRGDDCWALAEKYEREGVPSEVSKGARS